MSLTEDQREALKYALELVNESVAFASVRVGIDNNTFGYTKKETLEKVEELKRHRKEIEIMLFGVEQR